MASLELYRSSLRALADEIIERGSKASLDRHRNNYFLMTPDPAEESELIGIIGGGIWELTIGSSADNTLVLEGIAAHHARMVSDGTVVYLEAEGSAFGPPEQPTYLKGTKIALEQQLVLNPGDSIRFGECTRVFYNYLTLQKLLDARDYLIGV